MKCNGCMKGWEEALEEEEEVFTEEDWEEDELGGSSPLTPFLEW